MAWRRWQFAKAETLKNTEVWDFDLPTRGALSAILLHIEATNGSTSNYDAPLELCVKKIELTDGAKKLHSVTGEQEQALNLFATGQAPRSKRREAGGEVQSYVASLMFGRRFFDDDYFVDLSALSNPKIEVDFDLTAVRAVGATGFADGSGVISAIALIDSEGRPGGPRGYFRAIEQHKWTTAGSGDERVKLPVDYPYRRLMVRAHLAGNCPDDVITDIKLSFDGGKWIPIEEKTKHAAHHLTQAMGDYPRIEMNLYRIDGETVDLRHASIQAYAIGAVERDEVNNMENIGCGNVTLRFWDASAGAASTTRQNRSITIWPVHPWMCSLWDFEPWGFLPANEFGKADLYLTQAVANAAGSVVLEEVATQ